MNQNSRSPLENKPLFLFKLYLTTVQFVMLKAFFLLSTYDLRSLLVIAKDSWGMILYLTPFCKLHFRVVEKPRFVILKESLLSPSTEHAQKFMGQVKKDASSMTIPAFFTNFRSLNKKCRVVKGNDKPTPNICDLKARERRTFRFSLFRTGLFKIF